MYNDKLLVSRVGLSELFTISLEGRHLSTIPTNNNDELYDATWTPRGNIVYTIYNSNKVVVMSESGNVITKHTQMIAPRYLSVSNDDIIYLADWETGVYQSTDDGVSWSLVFNLTNEWHCWQAIKVTTDHSDDIWTLEEGGDKYYLRLYSVVRTRGGNTVTRINVPTTDDKRIELLHSSSLTYDGNMNIFLSDCNNKAIHVMSASGKYHCKLSSSHHVKNYPYRLAVDRARQVLYVGQNEGVVEVFKLAYGAKDVKYI